ncbi:MAG: glycosyltransferase family 39 protein [Syntrophothermus sp.]
MKYLNRYKYYILLFLFVIIGSYFRVHNLSTESLWLDETISLKFAEKPLLQLIYKTANDVHPPLYYVILHYWIKYFGSDEYGSRLLSVVFGVLLIIAVFFLAKYLFDDNVAIITSLLVTVSAFHIKYSQETRGYSLLALLSVLSFYYYLKFIDNGKKNAVPYIFLSSMLIYTHVFGMFVLLIQFFYAVFLSISKKINFEKVKVILFNFASIFVLFIPWIFIFYSQIRRVQKGFWIRKPDITTLYFNFVEFAGSYFNKYAILLAALFLIFAILGFFIVIRNKNSKERQWIFTLQSNEKIILLGLWLVLPIALPYTISRYSEAIFNSKYAISSSIPFFILVSAGIMNFRKYIVIPLVILIFYLSTLSIESYFEKDHKEQWRETTSYIKEKFQPDDLIVVYPWDSKLYAFDYYFNKNEKKTDLLTFDWESIKDKSFLSTIEASEAKRIWMVFRYQDYDGAIDVMKKNNYILSDEKKFHGVTVYFMEKKDSLTKL